MREMSDPAFDVVEFVLTAAVYDENERFEPDDLPPAFRRPFWSEGRIERPLAVTADAASEATGVDRPWEAVSGLMFTDREEFSGTLSLTDREMATEWYSERTDARKPGARGAVRVR